MIVPVGYKATDVGVIPEDWEVKPLKDVGRPLIGLTYSPRDVREAGTLVLRSSNVQNGRLAFRDNVFVDPAAAAKALVQEHDILICVRNGSRELIGKCAKIDHRANGMAFGAFMSIYRSTDHDFVFHQFQSDSLRRQINEHLGATINQITNSSFNGFKIAWPPKEREREQIAEALSDVDEAIAAQEAVIAKKRALKTATMQALLSGTRRLPGFSGDWAKVQIGQLGRWVGGATPSMANARYWTNGTIPWASSSDVRSGRLSSTSNAITAEAVKNTATREVPTGTILMVTRSGILRRFLPVAIATRNIAINQDLKALLVDPTFDPNFIYHAISVRGDDILKMCMKAGTTVESIDLDWLKQFEIDIPEDKYEQVAIATALFDCEDEIILLGAKLAKLRDLKAGMMQQLLTGKIRLV